MNLFRFLLLCVIVLCTNSLYAQNYAWAKSFDVITAPAAVLQESKAIATDAQGNVYTAGTFRGTLDFDPGPGVFSLAGTNNSGFISKLDAAGNFVWAKKVADNIFLESFTLGSDGSLYTTGYFTGTVDFDPGPGVVSLTGPSYTIFISKLTPAGDLAWAKAIPAGSTGDAKTIAVDDDNNVYAGGDFYANIDVDPGPGVVSYIQTNGDGFILKLNATGDYVSSYHITGVSIDTPYGMVIKNGFLYVATWASTKANVMKMDLDLNVIWSKTTEGGSAWPRAIAVDNAGNVFAGGEFYNTCDFDPGAGVVAASSTNGTADIFVMKLDVHGNLKWVRIAGGASSSEGIQGLSADANGDVYVAGKAGSSGFLLQPNDNSSAVGGSSTNSFVEKLNSFGSYLYVARTSSPNSNVDYAITTDNSGNVFTTGYIAGPCDFDPDPNVYAGLSPTSGTASVFIWKLSRSNHISGTVFLDINNDGVMQSNEQPFTGRMIKATSGSAPVSAITQSTGRFDMYVNAGNYNITVPNLPVHYTSTVPFHSASFTGNVGGEDSLNNFPIYPTPGINDLSVDVSFNGTPRPGSFVSATITYRNTGTTTLTGNVTLTHAGILNYQSASPAPAAYTNPLLTWNFTNLQPLEFQSIDVLFSLPTTVPQNTPITNTARIYPVVNDLTPADNTDSTTGIAVSSYDPNDKSVKPAGTVSTAFIQSANNDLDYTVRFQNTGTDTAFLVMITDTIQTNLDISTLKVKGASHPYTAEVLPGNLVRFTFRNILLPDSTTNEPRSHGFIEYSIKPFSNTPAGSVIKNKAAIFFDYNSAVLTNETQTPVSVVVPVSLEALNIRAAADCKSVNIKWSTAVEAGNDHFVIEKSADGVAWKAIASVGGAASGSVRNDYSYTDFSPVEGSVYYRLKQINTDGTFTNSFVRKAACGDKENKVFIFPNPATSFLNVDAGMSFSYELYTLKGQLVLKGNSAESIKKINVNNTAKGMYLLIIKTANGTSEHKISVQ